MPDVPALEFAFDESLQLVRESARRFASERIAPRAAQIDADNAFPNELWPQLGDLGLLGVDRKSVV